MDRSSVASSHELVEDVAGFAFGDVVAVGYPVLVEVF